MKALSAAELIIAVFDASRELDADDEQVISRIGEARGQKIALLNKCDLKKAIDKSRLSSFEEVIEISAMANAAESKQMISDAVNRLFINEKLRAGEDAIVSSARQNTALLSAAEYVDAAIAALRAGEFADAAASEIELALGKLAELDGRAVAEDVLSEIFSKFCVGK